MRTLYGSRREAVAFARRPGVVPSAAAPSVFARCAVRGFAVSAGLVYRPGTVRVTVAPDVSGVPGAGDWAVTLRESSPISESSVKAMP